MQTQPNIIFLHGWGQSVQVWHQQIRYFTPRTRVYAVNLPGHGGASDIPQEQWISHLAQEIRHHINTHNHPTILVGWSLGGQIALKIHAHLSNLAGLALVSTTPTFRQQHDWKYGCSHEVWQGFSQGAAQQDPKLMRRFFQMMLHGDKLSRKEIQTLSQKAIDKRTPPTFQGLQTGLSFLSNLDLRDELPDISLPTLVLHGAQDVIVPAQAGQYLAEQISHANLHVFEDCGHAPFLTHHVAFNQKLELWWKSLSV